MHVLKSFFTWILVSVFPPRTSARLVHEAYTEHTPSLATFYKPHAISNNLSFTALLPYRVPLIQACVLEAKFHRNCEAQKLLGGVLARYVEGVLTSKNNYIKVSTILVPIPLGRKRRKDRGYNQIEEISRFAVKNITERANSIQISLKTTLLQRIRETNPQMTLDRTARLANMQDAFAATQPLDPDTIYILLDDVVTTGATLLAAYEALQKGGATRILVVALAH